MVHRVLLGNLVHGGLPELQELLGLQLLLLPRLGLRRAQGAVQQLHRAAGLELQVLGSDGCAPVQRLRVLLGPVPAVVQPEFRLLLLNSEGANRLDNVSR